MVWSYSIDKNTKSLSELVRTKPKRKDNHGFISKVGYYLEVQVLLTGTQWVSSTDVMKKLGFPAWKFHNALRRIRENGTNLETRFPTERKKGVKEYRIQST